jgi:hypothetical protein
MNINNQSRRWSGMAKATKKEKKPKQKKAKAKGNAKK